MLIYGGIRYEYCTFRNSYSSLGAAGFSGSQDYLGKVGEVMTAVQRFQDKVMVIAGMEDACHLWTAQLDKNGYGQFSLSGTDKWQAHRAAYLLFVGPIPAGKVIMHTCDNPRCVNIDHLRVGTQKDNMLDKCAKGRWRGGRRKKS